MKITIVQGPFLPVPPIRGGAVEKLWFEMGKEFARLGHSVFHISRKFPDLSANEVFENVTHHRIAGFDMPSNFILSNFFDLLYSLRAFKSIPDSDIVVSNTFWLPIILFFSFFRTSRLVISVERMPKGQMLLYRHADLLRCCSVAVSERVKREVPDIADKVVVFPNPLPFQLEPTSAVAVKKKKIILYCGRLHPEKGLHLLLDSYKIFNCLGLDGWSLRIVGPSEISAGGGGTLWLRDLKSNSSFDGDHHIKWVGPIYNTQDLFYEYQSASIFVYPSLSENGEAMGLAPLEAMAFGAVPIVSSLKCFQDFIIPGVNGLTFDHRSPNASLNLAKAIHLLASNRHYLEVLSSNSVQVRKSHNLESVAFSLLSCFARLL